MLMVYVRFKWNSNNTLHLVQLTAILNFELFIPTINSKKVLILIFIKVVKIWDT